MKNGVIHKLRKPGTMDSADFYILMIAGIVFLHIAFPDYTQVIYGDYLIVPCMLFLGVMQERGSILKCKKMYVLPFAMVAWFFILQLKRERDFGPGVFHYTGLFLCTYLFAFPLASLLQDGEKKKALKVLAGAYLAAAAAMTMMGLLLVLDCLPAFLSKHVSWDGARLELFWHPNVTGCFLMIGTVFCTIFLAQAKKPWSRLAFCILLIMMLGALALTRCRTAIILTGGFLGSILFFEAVKRGRKWFLPGVLAVLVVTAAFFEGAEFLYQANHRALLQKYTLQYSEQIASDHTEPAISETEISSGDADSQKETIPIAVNPNTGEVYLKTVSGQGSISQDFGTLNGRARIWSAAGAAIRETPSILYWGMLNPGEYVSSFNSFQISHMHNAWIECLMKMGCVGFLIAVLFTLITLWNCVILLLKHYRDFWKRNVAMLTLCLLAAAVLEPYLFYTTIDYHAIDLLFFLCAGYLAHWQKADNYHILMALQSRISSLKKC